MTNLEKAEGYLQLLKEEGKLDEMAFQQLKYMYQLSDEEANSLIEKFKTTDAYRKITSRNIVSRFWLLICILIAGSFMLYTGTAKDGIGIFSVYAVIYFLGAFGLFVYILQLLAERFNLASKFPAIKGQSITFLVIALGFFADAEYQVYSASNKATEPELKKLQDLLLSENCVEKSTGGRSPSHYYSLHAYKYGNTFIWRSNDHLYAFRSNELSPPNLSKGDKINIYLKQESSKGLNDQNLIGNYPDIEIYDIEKNGQRFLDPKLHAEKEKESAEKFRNISLLIFAAAIFVFILENKKALDKQKKSTTQI